MKTPKQENEGLGVTWDPEAVPLLPEPGHPPSVRKDRGLKHLKLKPEDLVGISTWQREILEDMERRTAAAKAGKPAPKPKRSRSRKRQAPPKPVPRESPNWIFNPGSVAWTLYGAYPRIMMTQVERLELHNGRWLYKVSGREDLVPEQALFTSLEALESACRGVPVE